MSETKNLAESSKIIEELSWWLKQTATETPFGEIGFVICTHHGQVVRIKRIIEETKRLS